MDNIITQKTMQPNFNGLRNQGATCYMNSMLQTLFMTPEFKKQLYSYRSTQLQEELVDSIPYQLQRLFLNLQYSQGVCSTKKLIKSFQWEDAQKFQQHDVQEFCRVLFDAIQNSSEKQWIHKNYAGLMKSYVRCENGHSSQRLENFMDLSLTIKNPFENVQNHSLEQAIKGFLKPEKLEGGDKYMCEECGKKVNATKGLELVTLPRILTIQLKRFELNYQTMQRQKINEFVYFPSILYMQKFINEYEKIQIQDIPKKLQQLRSLPVAEDLKKKIDQQSKKNSTKFQKPVLKRKNSQQKLRNLQQVSFLDDIGMGKQKKQTLTSNEEKLKNIQALKNLKFNKDDLDKKYEKVQNLIKNKQKKQAPKQTFQDFEDDILFGIGGAMIAQSTNWQQSKPTIITRGLDPYKYTQQEEKYDSLKQYPSNTYSLFAVLVHDGNAYHGHYYAYIKHADDWYRFDDSHVAKVSEMEIRKYGDLFKYSQGANAYMLFYRSTNSIKQLGNVQADQQLIQSLKNSTQKVIQKPTDEISKNRIPYDQRVFEKPFVIKLYYPKPSFIILDNISLQMTVQQLKQNVKQKCAINEQDKNWRLRLYNSFEDNLLMPIEDPHKTLRQLRLRQNVSMTIEFKKQEQTFQQFDPKLITININIWKQGLFYQKEIVPLKIRIRDDQSYQKLFSIIKQKTGLNSPKVIRRSFVKGNNVAEIIEPADHNCKLISLRFFNNLNLYIEEPSNKLRWQEDFDSEKYRVSIKFNNPITKNIHTVYYDNRKTFKDLKLYLGSLIDLPQTEFRVKSSQDAPQFTGKKRLSDLRIIGEATLYLQLGKSTKNTIYISKGKTFNTTIGIGYDKFPEQQYEIQLNKTIEDLQKEIASRNNIIPQNVRIRQYKRAFGQIFKGDTILSKLKDKVLVWQQVEDDYRGIQVYTRIMKEGILQEYNQIFLQYDANYQELALIIAENYQIDAETVEACTIGLSQQDSVSFGELKWQNVNYQQGKIFEMPFYINTDGSYLMIREGEKKQFKPKSKAAKEGFTYGGLGNKQAKQKGLKITVKKNMEKKLQSVEQENGFEPQLQTLKQESNQ